MNPNPIVTEEEKVVSAQPKAQEINLIGLQGKQVLARERVAGIGEAVLNNALVSAVTYMRFSPTDNSNVKRTEAIKASVVESLNDSLEERGVSKITKENISVTFVETETIEEVLVRVSGLSALSGYYFKENIPTLIIKLTTQNIVIENSQINDLDIEAKDALLESFGKWSIESALQIGEDAKLVVRAISEANYGDIARSIVESIDIANSDAKLETVEDSAIDAGKEEAKEITVVLTPHTGYSFSGSNQTEKKLEIAYSIYKNKFVDVSDVEEFSVNFDGIYTLEEKKEATKKQLQSEIADTEGVEIFTVGEVIASEDRSEAQVEVSMEAKVGYEFREDENPLRVTIEGDYSDVSVINLVGLTGIATEVNETIAGIGQAVVKEGLTTDSVYMSFASGIKTKEEKENSIRNAIVTSLNGSALNDRGVKDITVENVEATYDSGLNSARAVVSGLEAISGKYVFEEGKNSITILFTESIQIIENSDIVDTDIKPISDTYTFTIEGEWRIESAQIPTVASVYVKAGEEVTYEELAEVIVSNIDIANVDVISYSIGEIGEITTGNSGEKILSVTLRAHDGYEFEGGSEEKEIALTFIVIKNAYVDLSSVPSFNFDFATLKKYSLEEKKEYVNEEVENAFLQVEHVESVVLGEVIVNADNSGVTVSVTMQADEGCEFRAEDNPLEVEVTGDFRDISVINLEGLTWDAVIADTTKAGIVSGSLNVNYEVDPAINMNFDNAHQTDDEKIAALEISIIEVLNLVLNAKGVKEITDTNVEVTFTNNTILRSLFANTATAQAEITGLEAKDENYTFADGKNTIRITLTEESTVIENENISDNDIMPEGEEYASSGLVGWGIVKGSILLYDGIIDVHEGAILTKRELADAILSKVAITNTSARIDVDETEVDAGINAFELVLTANNGYIFEGKKREYAITIKFTVNKVITIENLISDNVDSEMGIAGMPSITLEGYSGSGEVTFDVTSVTEADKIGAVKSAIVSGFGSALMKRGLNAIGSANVDVIVDTENSKMSAAVIIKDLQALGAQEYYKLPTPNQLSTITLTVNGNFNTAFDIYGTVGLPVTVADGKAGVGQINLRSTEALEVSFTGADVFDKDKRNIAVKEAISESFGEKLADANVTFIVHDVVEALGSKNAEVSFTATAPDGYTFASSGAKEETIEIAITNKYGAFTGNLQAITQADIDFTNIIPEVENAVVMGSSGWNIVDGLTPGGTRKVAVGESSTVETSDVVASIVAKINAQAESNVMYGYDRTLDIGKNGDDVVAPIVLRYKEGYLFASGLETQSFNVDFDFQQGELTVDNTNFGDTLEALENPKNLEALADENGDITLELSEDITNLDADGKKESFTVTGGTADKPLNVTLAVPEGEDHAISGGGILTSLVVEGAGTTVTLGKGVTIEAGKSDNGGGVRVDGGATFILDGGIIEGNINTKASWTDGGGAVNVLNGKFIMNTGIIRNNVSFRGAGVFATGTNSSFEMNGGTIEGNTTIVKVMGGMTSNSTSMRIILDGEEFDIGGTGAGIFLYEGAQFTMNGGEIKNNTSGRAGSAIISSVGKLGVTEITINDGTIKGNVSPHGAITVSGDHSNIEIKGGDISGNTDGLYYPNYSLNSDGSYVYAFEETAKVDATYINIKDDDAVYFNGDETTISALHGENNTNSILTNVSWTGGTINGNEHTANPYVKPTPPSQP